MPVSELSHGEQRELELAVALATKPQLLLLDEPMAGLGVTESARMVTLLKELRKEVTIVLVEHDMEAVFALADRITRPGLWPRHRLRRAGRDPQQRRGQARLSRRQHAVVRPWLTRLPLLEVDGIETCYGLSQVLFGLSLSIESGEMVALMGRNGMGKTTTIRSIMGLTPARAGAIRFGGQEVRGLPSYKIAQLGIGLVPEGRQIFPNLTVRENLVAASGNRARQPRSLDHRKDPRAVSAARRAQAAIWACTLSGGEQQMLAIGRALMTNPRLLILDEATEGLAPLIREEIWNCLSMLKARGQSVLVIDKNVGNLSRIADRHYIIERGRTVWSGTSEQLIAEPDLQHRYLGI